MYDTIIKIFEGWGFESNGLCATKDALGGRIVCDTIRKREKGIVSISFCADINVGPKMYLLNNEHDIPLSRLEGLNLDATAEYLKWECETVVESVARKILFNKAEGIIEMGCNTI